jgi:excisionase family DNA binding protein
VTATDHTQRIGGDRVFIRLSEAATALGISTRQAYRWADRGRLPTVDLGGERGRYVPARALEALIDVGAELAPDAKDLDGHRAADEARTNKGPTPVTKP